MKKSRIVCFVLSLLLVLSCGTVTAQAYHSDIVDAMSTETRAALLVDPDTDFILYEQNAYDKAYPASITKVMAAILVMEALDNGTLSLDQEITATQSAWKGLDYTSSNQNIQPGETMTVKDLVYCLLVASANEAGNILATEISGSIEAFVEDMNEKAIELGCTGTHFMNPHGMPDDNHYTTAYDLYLIAKYAMTFDFFREVVSTAEYYTSPTNLNETPRHFFNTNALLSNKKYQGYEYEYCTGIKTGTTNAAGSCLLSSAEKDGQRLICVVLGCENPTDANGNVQRKQFSETRRLFKWGFDNFSVHSILDATNPIAEVPVTLSTQNDYVSVIVDGALEAQLPNDITSEDFEWTYDLPESVEAPVTQGQKLGTMTVTLDGKEYGTVDLVAVNSVDRSSLLAFKHTIGQIVRSWQFILIAVVILVLVIVLTIRAMIISNRKKRYGGRRSKNYKGK